MNGDDDPSGSVGAGTDWGGGMYTEPSPPPPPDDDDDGNSVRKTRRVRRHPRPQFRSTRKARRTGGR
jgi:hypothetical protein